MIRYLRFGYIPDMHHTAHYVDGELLNEYCFTREGFEEPYSILYLVHPPTAEVENDPFCEPKWGIPVPRQNTLLQRRHFQSGKLAGHEDYISGRVILAFNDKLTYGLCHPEKETQNFFANNDADELYFLREGEVRFQSLFGNIHLSPGDYLIIPRSCPYRLDFKNPPRLMVVEAKGGIGIPPEFRNESGQLAMDAPYSERSFKVPEWDHDLFEKDGGTVIVRKRQGRFTRNRYEKNYFRMSGWDGQVYPCAINLADIQPKTGRVHLPPTSHLTFAGAGVAVMSFLPRVLDFDDKAVPCPFYHSSVDCDELLLYVSGDFTSRKGVGPGSISYHPSGIPHGPHPGAYKGSIGLKRTQEQAVMVDTFEPLHLTPEGEKMEDPHYPLSWRE